jgi:hypothetical protein
MNQRCSLDGATCLFIPHEVSGNAAKLVIDARRQLFQRALVAVGPGTQQLCGFRALRIRHTTIGR